MVCLSETAVLELLDGRLAEGSAPGAEEHLAACSDCRRLVSELARTLSGATPSPSPTSSEDPARLQAGLVLGGRFRLERRLGEGGMGEVWAAQHLVTRRPIALKVVRAATDDRGRSRVAREARAASAVKHPGILPVLDVIELDDGTPALVMELLTGRSLGARLAAGGALSLAETVRVLLPVAEAVHAAHAEGVIHRDLKPDNVFFCDDGSVKVLDFGVAKVLSPDENDRLDLTRTGELVGTPHYMAPEQAFGEPDLDGKTDVWGLGVTLYECLAGRRPFEGDSLGKLLRAVSTGRLQPIGARVPALPASAARLVDRMLSVERAQRPAMAEVIVELRALAAGVPVRGRRRSFALSAAISLALVGGALGVWWATRTRAAAPSVSAAVLPVVSAPAKPAPPPSPPEVIAPPGPSPSLPLTHAPVRAPKPVAVPADPPPPARGPGGIIEPVPF